MKQIKITSKEIRDSTKHIKSKRVVDCLKGAYNDKMRIIDYCKHGYIKIFDIKEQVNRTGTLDRIWFESGYMFQEQEEIVIPVDGQVEAWIRDIREEKNTIVRDFMKKALEEAKVDRDYAGKRCICGQRMDGSDSPVCGNDVEDNWIDERLGNKL